MTKTNGTTTASTTAHPGLNADGALHFEGKTACDSMAASFDKAAAANPQAVTELNLILAGRPARLRMVGEKLRNYVGRPLAHLQATPGDAKPELTIDLWDEAETGVGCEGCVIDDDLGIDGVVSTSTDGQYVGYQRARSFTSYDRKGARMIGWSSYQDRVCLYEQGRPLHVPFSLWHCDIGFQVMHSGLVAHEQAGVLFPGMGGSGKSTSSITCLEAGLQYLGDDYIALSRDHQGQFIGHSLYNSSHLEPHHLERFTNLRNHAIEATMEQEDKWLILLNEVFPGSFQPSVPIRAIAMPNVVDAETTTFRRASKGQALMALAPSSLVMIPGKGAAGMKDLGDLVEHVPCYWLDLGRDLSSIPVAVKALLKEASRA